MPKKTGLNVQGLDGARAITGLLGAITATKAGADWVGGLRESEDGSGPIMSNARVLKYLADGGRDIRATPGTSEGDKDQQDAAEALSGEIVKQLNLVGKTFTNTRTNKTRVLTDERQLRAGLSDGLKKAAKLIARRMYDRLKARRTNDGGQAKEVTEAYARQRKSKHGVAENVVFIATRQLAEALQKGKVKIRIDTGGIGRALKSLGR